MSTCGILCRSLGFMADVFPITVPLTFVIGTWIILAWAVSDFNPFGCQKDQMEEA